MNGPALANSDTEKNKRKNILIVDDEESIRFILQSIFYRSGYNPIVAANGKHALQKVLSGSDIDLVVCDIKTPVMSGLQFLSEIRKAGINTPVILITGVPDKDKILMGAKLGAATVMVKPVRPSVVVEKAEEIFKSA